MAQNLTFNLDVDTNQAVSSINTFFNTFDQGAAKAKNQLNQAFGQTLQTTVEINLKNGELVASKIQKAGQESKKLEQAVKAINGEFGKTPNQLRAQLRLLKDLQGNTQKYGRDGKKLSKDWELVTRRIKEASNELKKMTALRPFEAMKQSLTGIVGKFALVQTLANAATSALMGIGRAGQEFVAMSVRMETLQLQLEAFTGGALGAQKAFDEFTTLASQSPFNLEQIADAGRIMMAFGLSTNEAVTATRQLTTAAAATGGNLNNLARNLGQIQAQGQAYTRDLTQFAIQGIPIWGEMSKVTGKSVQELKKMASEGQISFDIVTRALENLTGEGTEFAEIAERMQETFAGRFAKIEASLNALGLSFINTFNAIDKSLGSLVSGSMKAVADIIMSIAKNLPTITSAFIGLAAAAGMFFTISNWSAISNGITGAVFMLRLFLATQMKTITAQTVFNALSGNWPAIVAAIAAGGVAYAALSSSIEGATDAQSDYAAVLKDVETITGELTDKERERYEMLGLASKEELDNYDRVKAKRDEELKARDAAIAQLEKMRDKIKENADEEVAAIRVVLDAQRERADEMREAQNAELDRVRERHDAALAAIDAEIGLLREKTKEEEALYNFQKRELEARIQSGQLQGEELLRAKARLSRMERQEKIAELLAKRSETQASNEKEIKEIKAKQEKQMEAILEKQEDNEKRIKSIRAEEAKRTKEITDQIKAAQGMTDTIDTSSRAVAQQIGLVKRLSSDYAQTSKEVDNLAESIRGAVAAQLRLNAARAAAAKTQSSGTGSSSGSSPGSGTLSARASGGPVSGGTSYQVNELGKEAFLSAAGKLSMINAPAFGTWKAPSSGTVIPAHLTKQLNVPTGGVNLSGSASSNAARSSSGGMASMISAIRGSMGGGDTFNQSVTVQSSNPTQAANNMMVEMTRLKRRRFR